MKKQLLALAALVTTAGLLTGTTGAQTTQYIGDNNTSSDRWNVPANWTNGVPAGATNVVISAAKPYVCVWSANTPTYTGNLTMEAGTTIQVGWTTDYAASWNALGTAGSTIITMGNGAYIKGRTSGNRSIPAIQLLGNVTFSCGESTQTPVNPTFGQPITGAYTFTLQANYANTSTFSASNTFSMLNLNPISGRGGNPGTVIANAAGSLGAGDVNINRNTADNKSLKLQFSASDAMSSATGTLKLDGLGPAANGLSMVRMNTNNTIGFLKFVGYPVPAGTYGRVGSPGMPANQVAWIEGDSVLTVSSDPGDTTPPTYTFAGVGQGGSTTTVYVDEPVTYTITLNEPVTNALTSANLENATGTGMTIVSFTAVPATSLAGVLSYTVVVKATEPGTLQLQVKSGTVINDLFGNALSFPAADNDTLTVNPWPLIKGQLGRWKPWANGGINPKTGNPWAIGDTYHLAFVSSGTRDATLPDIADYHAFVQAAATAAGIGGTTWYCIGQSINNPTRDVNAPPMTTLLCILRADGGTKLADNGADLANGPDNMFCITEAGTTYLGSVATGSIRKFGDPANTVIENGSSDRLDNGWWQVYNASKTGQWHFYAISAPLTLLSNAPAGTVIRIK